MLRSDGSPAGTTGDHYTYFSQAQVSLRPDCLDLGLFAQNRTVNGHFALFPASICKWFLHSAILISAILKTFSVKLNHRLTLLSQAPSVLLAQECKTLESSCVIMQKDCNFMQKVLFSVTSKSVTINYTSEWSSFWSWQEKFFLTLESNISIFSKKVWECICIYACFSDLFVHW